MAAEAWLTLSNLGCRRGRAWLFRDLGFALEPGQLTWLRGPNGSGKTSLLRIVAGLTRPECGALHWHAALPRAGRLLYLGHRNALKDDFDATEALRALAALAGQPADAAALHSALRTMAPGVRPGVPVRALSQGQRRRVALARLALPGPARVWVLDEPYDALDEQGIDRVNALLDGHLARGGSVLLTSHLPARPSAPAAHTVTLGQPAAGAGGAAR